MEVNLKTLESIVVYLSVHAIYLPPVPGSRGWGGKKGPKGLTSLKPLQGPGRLQGLRCARNPAREGGPLHAAVHPLSLAHLRHAPQAHPNPPGWWRARASATAPPPDPPPCGTALPPVAYRAACAASKLERRGAGAKGL